MEKSLKKRNASFLDIHIFGLHLKSWQGVLFGIVGQFLLGTFFVGSFVTLLSGIFGLIAIASLVALIRDLFRWVFSKSKRSRI